MNKSGKHEHLSKTNSGPWWAVLPSLGIIGVGLRAARCRRRCHQSFDKYSCYCSLFWISTRYGLAPTIWSVSSVACSCRTVLYVKCTYFVSIFFYVHRCILGKSSQYLHYFENRASVQHTERKLRSYRFGRWKSRGLLTVRQNTYKRTTYQCPAQTSMCDIY